MFLRTLILVSSAVTLASATFNATSYVSKILDGISDDMAKNGERNWAANPQEFSLAQDRRSTKLNVVRAYFTGLDSLVVGDDCSFKNRSSTAFVECLVKFNVLNFRAVGNSQGSSTPLVQFSATLSNAFYVFRMKTKGTSYAPTLTLGVEPTVALTFQRDPYPNSQWSYERNALLREWIQAQFEFLVGDEVVSRLDKVLRSVPFP